MVIAIYGCSQKLQPEDLKSRENAEKVINKNFLSDIKEENYIVFSVAEKNFLIVIEKQNSYEEFFYNQEKKIKEKKSVYEKNNELMQKMFNKKNYHTEFITFNSDFFKPNYELSSGNITYFSYVTKKKKRLGEARLSFFIQPNPIDAEIYIYLTNKILEYGR